MLFAEYSTAFFLKRQASRSHKFNIPHSLQECSGLFQVFFLCIPLRERHTCGHRLLAHADCVSTYSTEVMWSRVIRPTAFWNEKQRSDLSQRPVIWSGTTWIAIPYRFCMGAQWTARHNESLVSYSDNQRISPSFN